MSAKNITTSNTSEGDSLSVVGDTYHIVTGGEHTDNAYTLIDMLVPPGGGPGPHAHAKIQESFYVMEGEIEVTTQEQKYTVKAGSFINIPYGGTVHMFTNKTTTTAHMLCITTPAGMEDMFKEIGKPVAPGTFFPKPELKPDDLKKFKAIAEKYGQELYPPNYFEK